MLALNEVSLSLMQKRDFIFMHPGVRKFTPSKKKYYEILTLTTKEVLMKTVA